MSQVKVTADSGGGTVAWKAPATTTSNAAVVLTLPVDDGAANTFLKSNGSGVTSWAGPTASEIATTSGTASASTYLCGNNTWGTPSGGKVLQIVQAVKTDATSQAQTQNTWVDIAGLSANITPASGSKVLVQYNVYGGTDSGPDNLYMRMVRGSTAINVGPGTGNRQAVSTGHWANHNYDLSLHSSSFLDGSPGGDGSTAITYKVQWTDYYGNTTWCNRLYNQSDADWSWETTSSITLWEIGA